DILYGEGISAVGELIDLAVEFGVVKKSGSWFSYGQEKLGQGRETVKKALREDPALYRKIHAQVKELMKGNPEPVNGGV
ncbi:MAG: DNA recombination/repair protein RecA, partial [Chlorobiaceae bacterium]|nr:DNA recombination/repair protein RecA [Chlorobiaceae bacterium]